MCSQSVCCRCISELVLRMSMSPTVQQTNICLNTSTCNRVVCQMSCVLILSYFKEPWSALHFVMGKRNSDLVTLLSTIFRNAKTILDGPSESVYQSGN